MLLVTAGTIALTVYLFTIIPKGLFPQQDTGRIMGATEAPQDVSFPRMKQRQEALNAVVGKDPDVLHYVSFIGGGRGAGNTGTLFIDLKDKSSVADGMIVASGRSHRHVGAMADHLLRMLKEAGYGRARVEGLPHCDWVLIDAGDVIVHLFRPEVRAFYNLEKMWMAGGTVQRAS